MKAMFKKFPKEPSLLTKSIIVITSIFTLSSGIYFLAAKHLDQQQQEFNKQNREKQKIDPYALQEKAYQEKITSFNPKNYKLPSPNLSNANEQGGCKFGFGGNMPAIATGMFSETLYLLDAEKISTEIADEFAYAPFVQSYYVVGDILFRKPLDLFDRKIITADELSRNYSDSRLIIGNQAIKNSYQTMESKFGFPQSYLMQQAGSIASFSAFNDNCEKGIAVKEVTYTKVDLSGLPISSLLSATYQTSLYHGLNGLYNHTRKSPDFVSENFLEWVQSNNRAYLSIINNESKVTFPKGAYLYAIKSYINKNETVRVDFKQAPIDITVDEWKQQVAKQTNTPDSQITLIEEKYNDFKIIKIAKIDDLSPLSKFALAQKDGKFYLAQWELPESIEVQGNEPDRSQMVLINLDALSPVLSLLKSYYQGSQVDIGTDNANLDQKVRELVPTNSTDIDLKELSPVLKK